MLTAAVLEQAKCLFDEGLHTAEVADRLGIKRDPVWKAVRAGRLHAHSGDRGSVALLITSKSELITSKSERTGRDSGAPMGMVASNIGVGVGASVGALDAVVP